ncbi:MAG: sulfotransferase domain-containing protein [Archangium sp.]
MTLVQRVTRPLLQPCFIALFLVKQVSSRLLATLSLYRLRIFWLKPRPGDIYIATSPKAGTTWMQMIIYQLVTGGRGEFDHIHQVAPYLEQLVTKHYAEQTLDTLPSPRILKTHLGYEKLRPPKDSKVIYVTRNPVDSLLSFHHHMCLAEGAWMDFDLFFKQVMTGNNPWISHLESWWPHRTDENVLHVRYEELVKDLEGNLRRIASFCGIPLDESRMGEILEKCSLPYMKQNTYKFDFRLTLFDRQGLKDGFIRKTGVGTERAKLSADQQHVLDQKIGQVRNKLGIADGQP